MGRKQTPRKRLGHLEQRRVDRILSAVRGFQLTKSDQGQRETTLNCRLILRLQQLDPGIVNRGIAATTFVGETFRPECTLKGTGQYTLLAIECKRLRDSSAKRLFKEGLSQVLLYSGTTKVVLLVLYDFTTGARYAKAFGPGNRLASKMAKQLREQLQIHVVVLTP